MENSAAIFQLEQLHRFPVPCRSRRRRVVEDERHLGQRAILLDMNVSEALRERRAVKNRIAKGLVVRGCRCREKRGSVERHAGERNRRVDQQRLEQRFVFGETALVYVSSAPR